MNKDGPGEIQDIGKVRIGGGNGAGIGGNAADVQRNLLLPSDPSLFIAASWLRSVSSSGFCLLDDSLSDLGT